MKIIAVIAFFSLAVGSGLEPNFRTVSPAIFPAEVRLVKGVRGVNYPNPSWRGMPRKRPVKVGPCCIVQFRSRPPLVVVLFSAHRVLNGFHRKM